ncbi:MAG: universal stress protein [Desulfobacterales bacterium]|nr:universal stress protein [Desulfobacterales bacterium]
MDLQLLHIFRNTPLGRELMLQSAYFCRILKILPVIYVPQYMKFLMYFENDVVQVDLDGSYLRSPSTARDHAAEIIRQQGLAEPKFLEPKNFTASTLPDLPINFDFMCCPRTISDLSSKIGLGYIGPRVRRIIHSARFPVLIGCSVYKPWQSITVFFGGSANAVKALRLGFRLARLTGFPLDVFTQEGRRDRKYYEDVIEKENLGPEMDRYARQWRVYDSGEFIDNLYDVPHDALVIAGAYGHGVIKEVLFGSTLEKIQTQLPNTLLIVGPNYRAAM